AARLLRPGGLLVMTDFLIRPPGAGASFPPSTFERVIRREYGPWPELWLVAEEARALAVRARFPAGGGGDSTPQTLPTHAPTAPGRMPPSSPSAGHLLRWLHEHGFLSYVGLLFRRR